MTAWPETRCSARRHCRPTRDYDGLYVALAAVLDVPLLTADVRLGNVPACPVR